MYCILLSSTNAIRFALHSWNPNSELLILALALTYPTFRVWRLPSQATIPTLPHDVNPHCSEFSPFPLILHLLQRKTRMNNSHIVPLPFTIPWLPPMITFVVQKFIYVQQRSASPPSPSKPVSIHPCPTDHQHRIPYLKCTYHHARFNHTMTSPPLRIHWLPSPGIPAHSTPKSRIKTK